MIGRPRSNLELIKRELGHGLLGDIHLSDRSGQHSTIYSLRATIPFLDGSLLYITEYTNKSGIINKYYYDWEDANGYIKAQYHSEPHELDKRYQTATEPYHVHPPKNSILSNMDRFPNYAHKDLYSIVEGIIIFSIIPSRSAIE
ncbi:toxin-antitoxin system TumE family protein [Cohnella abietis]|uniref:Uncharacterized protein n=1 Tax=Cohnella abietis TaxID=2507935 RepID=A0A3T1CZN2_9BACL|nr:DUF6516 family protein [Cohnella abietis]BBI31312.1 hypothetical protein KCTCHS21_07110 [Cohnella abietis]